MPAHARNGGLGPVSAKTERCPIEELRHAVDLIVMAAIPSCLNGPSRFASRGDGGAANVLKSIIKKLPAETHRR
jgi:hypothetical protein